MRILLIAADGDMAAGLASGLRRQSYEIDLALRASTGSFLFQKIAHAIVIVDYGLPDMDACDLCRMIRAGNDSTRLLLLAPAHRCSVFEGFSAGVDDYLPRPADPREVLARINALARRCEPATIAANRIQAGDIVLNLDSKEVNRGGRIVGVTVSEFRLLEYMIRNKNKVLSREQIACGIWGSEMDDKARKLPKHMNNLRGKLAHGNPSGSGIYTVSRRGYLLVDPLK